ncbi:YbaB/EbfC family nucleoid-associated protein [Glycomyces buryatensis]|nr:YbaB/EbfC family nucleoid-associated protein [Glycomyces buryatensis]
MPGQDEIARQLAESRAALAQATASPEDHQAQPVTAESARGLISVTLGADGRVERIKVEPKGFKEGSDFIAEHVQLAMNDALAQRSKMVGTDEPVPDLGSINESMAAIQDSSLRQFQAMSASITQVMGKLGRRQEVRMFGEEQIAQQLAATRETLSQGPTSAGAQTEPIKTEAADGRIKITLGTDGRFEPIKMTLSALKDGPEALVEQLKLGLNDALDQRTEMIGAPAPVADPEAMNQRLAGLQDASLRQFQDMSASIGEVMSKLNGGR